MLGRVVLSTRAHLEAERRWLRTRSERPRRLRRPHVLIGGGGEELVRDLCLARSKDLATVGAAIARANGGGLERRARRRDSWRRSWQRSARGRIATI